MRAKALMYMEFTSLEVSVMMNASARTADGFIRLLEDGAFLAREAEPLAKLVSCKFQDPKRTTAANVEGAIQCLMTQRAHYISEIEMPFDEWFRRPHGSARNPLRKDYGAPLKEKADKVKEIAHRERSILVDALDRILAILRCGLDGLQRAQEVWQPIEDAGPPEEDRDLTMSMDKETVDKINRTVLGAGESKQPCA